MNLLHMGIFSDNEPQRALRNALRNVSESYKEYDWQNIHKNFGVNGVNGLLLDSLADVMFLQIQAPNIINPQVAHVLKDKGIKVFNFTGDVRQPLPQWYLDLAPYVVTLFTNEDDAEVVKKAGHDAHYFQIGYDQNIYKPSGDKGEFEIVFMGNNYKNTFPLSALRELMVEHLEKRYGKRFQVFGSGWENGINLNYQQQEEAKIYRGCKAAINLSHFNLKKYSSDRIFRIMGCGAPCLSHAYPDVYTEYERGEHLLTWSNFQELDFMIDECLNHDYRITMGEAGQKHVEKYFTWDYRINNQFLPLCSN